MESETKGILLGLVAVIAFGLTLPATKFVIPYLNPLFIGLGRTVVAAVFAIGFLLWFRPKIPSRAQFLQLIVVAFGVVIGFPIFSAWAMLYVPAAHGSVVLGVLPLITTIIGVLIGYEKPSIAFWLVSFLGSAFVVIYALLQGSGGFHIADLALLAAVISAAIGYAVGAKLTKDLGGWQVICWALVIGLPFTIMPAIYYAPPSLVDFPFSIYACFFYLALISQLLGFFAWYKGLALGGIARVSQIQLLQPFVTILASALFLNEIINIETIVFALLVVGSVWLSKRMPVKKLDKSSL